MLDRGGIKITSRPPRDKRILAGEIKKLRCGQWRCEIHAERGKRWTARVSLRENGLYLYQTVQPRAEVDRDVRTGNLSEETGISD